MRASICEEMVGVQVGQREKWRSEVVASLGPASSRSLAANIACGRLPTLRVFPFIVSNNLLSTADQSFGTYSSPILEDA